MWTGSSLCQCNLSLLCRLKMIQKWSKMIPKTVEAAEEALKTTQDGPETPQEAPQDRPRASPDHPDDPKRHPRGTPEASRGVRNRSKNRSENRSEIESGPKTTQVAPDLRFSMFFKGRKGVGASQNLRSNHPPKLSIRLKI